jgi:hypothetical protein
MLHPGQAKAIHHADLSKQQSMQTHGGGVDERIF